MGNRSGVSHIWNVPDAVWEAAVRKHVDFMRVRSLLSVGPSHGDGGTIVAVKKTVVSSFAGISGYVCQAIEPTV